MITDERLISNISESNQYFKFNEENVVSYFAIINDSTKNTMKLLFPSDNKKKKLIKYEILNSSNTLLIKNIPQGISENNIHQLLRYIDSFAMSMCCNKIILNYPDEITFVGALLATCILNNTYIKKDGIFEKRLIS